MIKTVKNIIAILLPKEKKTFLLHITFDIIISLLDVAFLAMLVVLVNFYIQAQTVKSFPFLSAPLFKAYPFITIGFFCLLYCVKNSIASIVFKAQQEFVYKVASRISENQLVHYFHNSFTDYVTVDSSVYTKRISQQPIEFCHYVLRGLQQVIGQAVLVAITIMAILFYSAKLFVLLFLILLPPVIVMALIMKKRLSALRLHAKTVSEKSLQHLNEALAGYIESYIYDKKDFFVKRYVHYQDKLNRYLAGQQVVQGLPSRLMEAFCVLGLFVLMVLNKQFTDTAISLLTIGAFMAAAYKIIPGVVKILNGLGQIKAYEFTVNDLQQNNVDISAKTKDNTFSKIQSVEFKNVCFSYNGKALLSNFNLSMASGDFIGISGLSGKGKTTIVNILLGFLNPDAGHVLINENVTTNSCRKAYHQRISYARQQSFFMYDTLLNNIVFEEADYSKQKLRNVIDATGIHSLMNHTDVAENMISEQGRNISGGQRQRIALARALYKDFDLIILDEPCSELDEQSEIVMLKNFQKLSAEGKMVLLITHNQESLSFCNKVVFMNAC